MTTTTDLTIRDAAHRLAVSERTIRRMISRQELPIYRVGASVRIRPEDIEAIRSGAVAGEEKDDIDSAR